MIGKERNGVSQLFTRNVVKMAGGTVASQGLHFLFLPLLTRLYVPEAFGVFAVYYALAMIASKFAGGAFEYAIPVSKTDDEAWHLLRLSSTCIATATGCGLIILLLYLPPSLSSLGPLLYLLPLSMGFATANVALSHWLGRVGEFGCVSGANVVASLTTLVIQLAIGITGSDARGLVAGIVAGAFMRSALQLRKAFATRPSAPSKEDLRLLAKRYSEYPLCLLTSNTLNNLASDMPILFFSKVFGAEITGQLSLSLRILNTPMQLAGQSIQSVFYPEAARIYAETSQCLELFKAVVSKLLLFGGLGLIMFSMTAPGVVSFVMGDDWFSAGIICQILAPFFIIRFVNLPVSCLLIIGDRQRLLVLWQVVKLIVFGAGLSVGLFWGGWKASIIGFGFAVTFVFGWCYVMCHSIAKGGAKA